jgi:hypothetical protein
MSSDDKAAVCTLKCSCLQTTKQWFSNGAPRILSSVPQDFEKKIGYVKPKIKIIKSDFTIALLKLPNLILLTVFRNQLSASGQFHVLYNKWHNLKSREL